MLFVLIVESKGFFGFNSECRTVSLMFVVKRKNNTKVGTIDISIDLAKI